LLAGDEPGPHPRSLDSRSRHPPPAGSRSCRRRG
jgi:hypothetical protein